MVGDAPPLLLSSLLSPYDIARFYSPPPSNTTSAHLLSVSSILETLIIQITPFACAEMDLLMKYLGSDSHGFRFQLSDPLVHAR